MALFCTDSTVKPIRGMCTLKHIHFLTTINTLLLYGQGPWFEPRMSSFFFFALCCTGFIRSFFFRFFARHAILSSPPRDFGSAVERPTLYAQVRGSNPDFVLLYCSTWSVGGCVACRWLGGCALELEASDLVCIDLWGNPLATYCVLILTGSLQTN